ncbi:hypothetical protein VIVU109784_16765 [Vibrio vulnificus]|uniref:Uncharacterized protein n=1 Tax=Vibrio vulnificus (strain CMCP6) TaxID=216895 RepID=A0A3Q0KXB2_VIBVU|nr:hypothetical protein [Vibrio vulnificus]AAO07089.1 hypothetical protein VV2_0116 [Vibrio vulnificus CMCP6]QBN16686.1 hypothetical protein E2I22_21575 [Vibrio vulnificus]HDY7672656.1 hypothetical protein [Vibrio vulnificus]
MSILIAVLFSLLLIVKMKVEKAYALLHIALHVVFLILVGQTYAVSYLIVMFFSAPIQIAMCHRGECKEKGHKWFSILPALVVIIVAFL